MALSLAFTVFGCAGDAAMDPDPKVLTLVRHLTEAEPDEVPDILRAIQATHPRGTSVIPQLLDAIANTEDQMVMLQIGNLIVSMGDGAIPPLIDALSSSNDLRAATAAGLLGGFGASASGAIPELLAALERPPPIRNFAMTTLRQLMEER